MSADKPQPMRASRPRLYLVTDAALCGGPRGVVETALAAARNGADIVQLRDHDATTRELVELARDLKTALAPTGVPIVIDDRLDVALAVDAAGVHLGQSDLDPVDARRVADAANRHDFHIGWSISTREQADAARALPSGTVDLLGIGPFRATPTKPDAATPLGLGGVADVTSAARALDAPSVIIGGVKLDDIGPLVAHGARGVAVVSAICGQPDPGGAARELRMALDDALANVSDGEGGTSRNGSANPFGADLSGGERS